MRSPGPPGLSSSSVRNSGYHARPGRHRKRNQNYQGDSKIFHFAVPSRDLRRRRAVCVLGEVPLTIAPAIVAQTTILRTVSYLSALPCLDRLYGAS